MRSGSFTRIISWALCALFLPALAPARALDTSAAAAVLMDRDSGRVLYAQDAHVPLPIASVTKLMTALVAAESVPNLDAIVTVDPQVQGVEGSSMYLKAGEKLSLRALLCGLLLRSGNDAAVAIAVYCAGDVPTFVDWMNRRARSLGMAETHFMNPSGLDAEGHFSSAYDMALLARAVLDQPDLAAIVATRTVTLGERTLTNHNKLLWRYEGCIGLKTGYTDEAGRTLVSAAARENATLICVTLNDPDDWSDHEQLLDYGFANFSRRTLVRTDRPLALVPAGGSLARCVPVVAETPLTVCLADGEQVTVHLSLPARLEAPVRQGQSVGQLTLRLNGATVGQTALLAGADAPSDRPGGLRDLLGALSLPVSGFPLPKLPVWQGPLTRISL